MLRRTGRWCAAAILIAGCSGNGSAGSAADALSGPLDATEAIAAAVPVAGIATQPELAAARKQTVDARARVLVLGLGDASDAGLDAALSTLALRPDLDVRALTTATTFVPPSTGDEVVAVGSEDSTDVLAAADVAGGLAGFDLVVVGFTDRAAVATDLARSLGDAGQSVIAVTVAGSADYAAASLQLLALLDEDVLGDAGAAVRVQVPTCTAGSLLGRVRVAGDPGAAPDLVSCTQAVPARDLTEATALQAGFVTIAQL